MGARRGDSNTQTGRSMSTDAEGAARASRRVISVRAAEPAADPAAMQRGGVKKMLELIDKKYPSSVVKLPDGSVPKPPEKRIKAVRKSTDLARQLNLALFTDVPTPRCCSGGVESELGGVRAMLRREVVDSHVTLPDGTTVISCTPRGTTPRCDATATPRNRMPDSTLRNVVSLSVPVTGGDKEKSQASPTKPDLCQQDAQDAESRREVATGSGAWGYFVPSTCDVLFGEPSPLRSEILGLQEDTDAEDPVQFLPRWVSRSRGSTRSSKDCNSDEDTALSERTTPFSSHNSALFGQKLAPTQSHPPNAPHRAATNKDGLPPHSLSRATSSSCISAEAVSGGWVTSTTFTRLRADAGRYKHVAVAMTSTLSVKAKAGPGAAPQNDLHVKALQGAQVSPQVLQIKVAEEFYKNTVSCNHHTNKLNRGSHMPGHFTRPKHLAPSSIPRSPSRGAMQLRLSTEWGSGTPTRTGQDRSGEKPFTPSRTPSCASSTGSTTFPEKRPAAGTISNSTDFFQGTRPSDRTRQECDVFIPPRGWQANATEEFAPGRRERMDNRASAPPAPVLMRNASPDKAKARRGVAAAKASMESRAPQPQGRKWSAVAGQAARNELTEVLRHQDAASMPQDAVSAYLC